MQHTAFSYDEYVKRKKNKSEPPMSKHDWENWVKGRSNPEHGDETTHRDKGEFQQARKEVMGKVDSLFEKHEGKKLSPQDAQRLAWDFSRHIKDQDLGLSVSYLNDDDETQIKFEGKTYDLKSGFGRDQLLGDLDKLFKKTSALRLAALRLAHEVPSLRKHLIPILHRTRT